MIHLLQLVPPRLASSAGSPASSNITSTAASPTSPRPAFPKPEARRRVAVELGLAQVREEVRDVWLTRWLRDFLYDLRFSARSLRRSPGFTAATFCSRWPSASARPPPSTPWSIK
jgi:hypothetical protein